MSVLFNEAEASAEVIKNLIREVRRLTPMALLQLNDGRIIRTEHYEEVTQEDLQTELDRLNEKSSEISALLTPKTDAAPADAPAPSDQAVAAEAPAAPAEVPAVEATADPAPAEATAAADVVTPDVTQVETVAAPSTAATDTNAPAEPALTLN